MGSGDSKSPTADRDPTLRDTIGTKQVELERWQPPAGYDVSDVLGRGGMGEVVLGYDQHIGRAVAIKHMLGAAPSANAVERFLREAKIQARLDHPAIVPVHAVGADADGRPYFVMKRLAGKTLFDVLSDPATTRQRLLRALVDVCLAVELAHTRRVVHRDLKPANIVLGDFGEVYVLDWGIARVLWDGPGAATDITTMDGETEAGLLGTPGYMAPEQVRGEDVSPAADVYALDAILFEILAGESLHPRGDAALATTIATPSASPTLRTPDRVIPPELDAICVAALAEAAATRPSARVVADTIQRYLDGDRDLDARRAIATRELATARDALTREDRATAMRAAGRAIALDPESRLAAGIVTRLMLEPPKEPPTELQRRLSDIDLVEARVASRNVRRGVLATSVLVPIAMWNGITKPSVFAALYAVLACIAVHAWLQERYRFQPMSVPLVLVFVLAVIGSRLAGPFVVIPTVLVIAAMGMLSQHELNRLPWLTIGSLVGALLAPLGLEATGVFDSTWSIDGGRLVFGSTALDLHGTPTTILLVTLNTILIVAAGLFARSLATSRRAAQRTLEIQAWHLEHLLPTTAARA